MERPVLTGERLVLRPPLSGDVQDRSAYGRNSEYRRMVGGDPNTLPPLTLGEVNAWYDKLAADPLSWVIALNAHCIGECGLHQWDKDHRSARYRIGLYAPAVWGQGYGTEATRLVLAYAFETLRLHRVDLRVLAFNARAIACYAKCGFAAEGIERESALLGGVWESDVRMSILEQEWSRN